jgi:hydroxymethylpyrimidine pyrophosphatase-like HAD family hydrolase
MKDPYLNPLVAVQRLKDEFDKYGKLIVALDFDDTIYDFHKKGHTYNAVIDLVRRCQELGFYIVMFTGTAKDKWPAMLEYCKSVGINPCAVNTNAMPLPFGNDGKIYYNVLLDDRAGLNEAFIALRETVLYAEQKKANLITAP